MQKDFDTFNGRVQYDREGNKINPVRLDGVNSADVKALAAKLAQIDTDANTHGDHYPIGELYGFRLLVRTDESRKEGELFRQNRFSIEGEGNIRYAYNNGGIAQEPKLAVHYFLHALEKIPSLIEKYRAETAKLSNDLPVLQEIVNTTWRKEDDLKNLKTELSALDRKIQLSLQPVFQEDIHDKPADELRQGEVYRLEPSEKLRKAITRQKTKANSHITIKSKINH